MNKILLAVISCAKFPDRIINCRETWLHDIPRDLDCRIFVGRGCPVTHTDIVLLDADDSYFGLPEKIKAMCVWAKHRGYDWVHKVDDDVYLHMERLLSAIPQASQYCGNRRSYLPGKGCCGFSYWLGREALTALSAAPLTTETSEEVWVAQVLQANGILAHHDYRYNLLERDQDFSADMLTINADEQFAISCPIEEMISLGECKTNEEMRKIHGAFLNQRFMAHS